MKLRSVFIVLSALYLYGAMAFAAEVPTPPLPPLTTLSFNNPVVDAADQGQTAEVVRLIRSGNSVNSRGNFGVTPLMRAAFRGHTELVETLIKLGADVGAVDLGGATALHLAVRQGHRDVAEQLLKAGAPVEAKDEEGITPLMRAANHRRADIIPALLAKGADPKKKNNRGETPLTYAVQGGSAPTLQALLASGVSLSPAEKNTLRSLAERKNDQAILALLADTAAVAAKSPTATMQDKTVQSVKTEPVIAAPLPAPLPDSKKAPRWEIEVKDAPSTSNMVSSPATSGTVSKAPSFPASKPSAPSAPVTIKEVKRAEAPATAFNLAPSGPILGAPKEKFPQAKTSPQKKDAPSDKPSQSASAGASQWKPTAMWNWIKKPFAAAAPITSPSTKPAPALKPKEAGPRKETAMAPAPGKEVQGLPWLQAAPATVSVKQSVPMQSEVLPLPEESKKPTMSLPEQRETQQQIKVQSLPVLTPAPKVIEPAAPKVVDQKPLPAKEAVTEVKVAEAVRVPVARKPQAVVAPLRYAPSDSRALKGSIWLEVGGFKTEQEASAFADTKEEAVNSAGVRMRVITSPYGGEEAAIRVGPVASDAAFASLCTLLGEGKRECAVVKDFGKSASIHDDPALFTTSVKPENSKQAFYKGKEYYWIQLGSYNQESIAERQRDVLKRQHKTLLGQLSFHIMSPKRGSHASPVFRLRAGPFYTEEDADAYCDKLFEEGVDCIAVRN